MSRLARTYPAAPPISRRHTFAVYSSRLDDEIRCPALDLLEFTTVTRVELLKLDNADGTQCLTFDVLVVAVIRSKSARLVPDCDDAAKVGAQEGASVDDGFDGSRGRRCTSA